MRTCVGCRRVAPQADLVRFVLGTEGAVAVDLAQSAFGRGAWVHPSVGCIERAPRGFARSFRTAVRTDAAALREALVAAADRRAEALVAAARRAGKLALGADPVRRAVERREAHLVVVARDARAAAAVPEVVAAVEGGRAVAWGSKRRIGEATGRSETALAAVLDAGLAEALGRAVAMSQTPEIRRGEP